jgi:hypothetical protein
MFWHGATERAIHRNLAHLSFHCSRSAPRCFGLHLPIPGAQFFGLGAAFFGFEDALLKAKRALAFAAALFLAGALLGGAGVGAGFFDGVEEAGPGELAVLGLAAGILRGDAVARRLVPHGDGGGDLVDVLSAGAAAAVEILLEILETQPERTQAFCARSLKIGSGLHSRRVAHPPSL